MSAVSTPNDSPVNTPIQPLHNPSQAAHVSVPKAPLGNTNQAPGMGAKALLAKKMAKSHNPTFVSPTDNLMTPVTQKLSAAKKKHFSKPGKPVQLFAQREEQDDDEVLDEPPSDEQDKKMAAVDDEENPF